MSFASSLFNTETLIELNYENDWNFVSDWVRMKVEVHLEGTDNLSPCVAEKSDEQKNKLKNS